MSDNKTDKLIPQKVRGRSFDPDKTIIDWYIDRRCNFHCSYCNPAIHDNWSEHNDLETLKSYALKICKSVNTKDIMFNLVGGEPLINPNILGLLEYLYELKKNRSSGDIKIFTVTNLSLPEKKLLGLIEYFDSIVASLHFQFIYKAPEKYLKKILAVYDHIESSNKDTYFRVRFMLAPHVIGRVQDFEKLLKKNLNGRNLKIDYRRVKMSRTADLKRFKTQDESDKALWHWKKDITDEQIEQYRLSEIEARKQEQKTIGRDPQDDHYNEDEHKYIQSRMPEAMKSIIFTDQHQEFHRYSSAEMTYNRVNEFKGYLCSAGTRYGKLDHLGRLFRSNCMHANEFIDLNTCEDHFDFHTQPVVCEMTKCQDLLDLTQPKIHPSLEPQELEDLISSTDFK